MNKNDVITGTFENNNRLFAFTIVDFSVVIFSVDDYQGTTRIYPDEDGYIWGITSENKNIAIYVGTDFEVPGRRTVNTWNYIISKYHINDENEKKIKGIRFQNGAVRTVFPCNSLKEETELEEYLFSQEKGNWFVYGMENDNKRFSVNDRDNLNVNWIFRSLVKQSNSVEEGVMLSNSISLLDLHFPCEKTYGEFYKYYGYVSNLLGFLSFRKNVLFEKISLLDGDSEDYLTEIAECFVKTPEEIEDRKCFNAIMVRYLSDEILERIVKNIIFSERDNMYIPIRILPNSEKELNVISPEKIQAICTAVETELNVEDIKLYKDKELQTLVESVKDVVKNHKIGPDSLPDKTYDVIYNSISHWGDSLSDRINLVWKRHENEIEHFLKIYTINKEQINIAEFVKKRNKITHEGFNEISDDEFFTSFAMFALLYCMVLDRMGLESKEICNFMDRRIIG